MPLLGACPARGEEEPDASSFASPTAMASVVGTLYVVGATIALATMAFPQPPGTKVGGLYVVYAIAYVLGGILLVLRGRLPRSVVSLALGIGTLLICTGILLTLQRSGIYAMFFVWVSVVAFVFLPRREALLHAVLIAVAYAAAVLEERPVGYVEQLAIVVGTVAVAGLLVGYLKARMEAAIAQHGRSEDALRKEREFMDAVLESLEDGVVACDADGVLTLFNRATRDFHGISEERLRPDDWAEHYDLYLPDGKTPMPTEQIPLFRAFQGESVKNVELVIAPRRGRKRTLLANGRAILNERGEKLGAVVAMHDITERKRFEGELQHLADHDAMTGLLNQRRFREELDLQTIAAHRYGRECAVLVLDIDNLKYVNDTLGHTAGDTLITTVARVLGENVRRSDVFGRLGGDEFAVLVPDADVEHAEQLAANLVRALRGALIFVNGQRLRPTLSVGVSVLRANANASGEELLMEADIAMYEAKERGRNRWSVFEAEFESHVTPRSNWVNRIRQALEDESFVIYGQPILEVASGKVSSVELLLRMRSDSGELVPPAAFLPVAERFGLIQAIDRHVVHEAIGLIRDHGAGSRPLCLHVNLSAKSLIDAELPGVIERDVRAAHIDPGALTFEVTETAAIVNIDEAKRFADHLVELGCRFALDDFGAGFGSFYYLKHLPFDVLKLDGDFIRALPSNPADQVVVKAIVDVARGLGKQTIAEYVGDRETLTFLTEHGVDYAQGEYVGNPRPIGELLSDRRRAGPTPVRR